MPGNPILSFVRAIQGIVELSRSGPASAGPAGPRHRAPLSLFALLLGVAIVALVLRMTVDALRPAGEVPRWHEVLTWIRLYLYYFATALAAAVLVVRAIGDLRAAGRDPRAHARVLPRAIALCALAVIGLFAAAQSPSEVVTFLVDTIFAIAVVAIVVGAVLQSTDLGASIGLVLCASPLTIHYYGSLFSHEILSRKAAFDSDVPEDVQHYGLIAVCIAALASPYCFAPRPLARALPRPVPLIVGLFVLALGAVIVRENYTSALWLSDHAFGIDLGLGAPAGEMALYLLALATMAWTLTSCAVAPAAPRRQVGVGLALLVVGGYGFAFPLAFLLGAAGLLAIADAAPELGPAETGSGPRTPPIDDATWQAYAGGLTTALRAGDHKVSAVTSRGEDDAQSTILVTERAGVPIKIRLERIGGALLCVDVVCGRDVGDARIAALTLLARGERWMTHGSHPAPPPAAPAIRTGDDAFDARFTCHGDGAALYALFDDGLRARAAASLDGWLAYWPGDAVRWRLYPGMGAPLDHPIPVSDLVLRRAATAERLASVIELVAAIAQRADVARVAPEPESEDGPASEPDPSA